MFNTGTYGQLVKVLTEQFKTQLEKELAVFGREYYDDVLGRKVSDNLRLQKALNPTLEGRLVLRMMIDRALRDYLGNQNYKEKLLQLKSWAEEGKIMEFPLKIGGNYRVPDLFLRFFFSELDKWEIIEAINDLLKALEED